MMTSVCRLLLNTQELVPPLPADEAQSVAAALGSMSGSRVYPRSIAAKGGSLFFLGDKDATKQLGILSSMPVPPAGFMGQTQQGTLDSAPYFMTLCAANCLSAAAMREALPFLKPGTLGLRKSVGCGDRLGLATPGHVRAVRQAAMAPIFAQQSMRENARTGRSPQQVTDEALWGVFQEGWRGGYGADADHLKTAADVDLCVAAGYTFYTFDPGEHVDNGANTAPPAILDHLAGSLPWSALETSAGDLCLRLADKQIDLGSFRLVIGREDLLRAAVKYGRAVAHTVQLYRHLAQVMGARPFELEMSVDETETVTSLAEHVYIAHELERLGVHWVSLAPRYLGTFEKGVDYIGDLRAFEESFDRHLAVAQAYGPYKLSLHSGSDKFSIYPIASRLAGELIHLKTAGTSYLEAMRAIAILDPPLFREMVEFCLRRYPEDRATYHVSADVERIPGIEAWIDNDLPALLDNFHGREVLHVTFGSVLKDERLKARLYETLRENEETYYQMLEAHFTRHLLPFNN